MNKNVLITLGVVAGVGAIAFLGYKLYKAKQTPTTPTTPTTQASSTGPGGAHQVAPGTTATGSNANQTNWLNTIGSLYGDINHLFTGNSTTPNTNSTTSSPVASDNSGEQTSLDDLADYYA